MVFSSKYFIITLVFLLFLIFGLGNNSMTLFTGKVTQSALNITISSTASINFSVNSIYFGPGSVDVGKNKATIDTLGNVIDGNWSSISGGFILNNIGNSNLGLYIKSGKTASEFIGGTNPEYYYMVRNEETNSCLDETVTFNSWIAVNTSGYGDKICSLMGYDNNNDSIRIDIKLAIPSDALQGEREDIFTATGISL